VPQPSRGQVKGRWAGRALVFSDRSPPASGKNNSFIKLTFGSIYLDLQISVLYAARESSKSFIFMIFSTISKLRNDSSTFGLNKCERA
jgi:hypothetical protein